MFILREKFDTLQAAHDTLVAERKQVTEALALKPEATTEDVLAAINSAGDPSKEAEQKLKDAELKQKTAEDAITKVTTSLDDLGPSVKDATTPQEKVEAVRALLAEKPGASQTIIAAGDPKQTVTGVDQETIDNLPHNKEFDENQLK